MGIFSRRARSIEVSPGQLARAQELMIQWQKCESPAEWSECAARIGGLGDWNWWLEAARVGTRSNEFKLVHGIAGFAAQVKSIGVLARSGLGEPPRALRRAIDEELVRCLAGAPLDLVLETEPMMDGSTSTIDVAQSLEWARMRLDRDKY